MVLTCIPAFLAAWIPLIASSKTKHCETGGLSIFSRAARKISGAGLPLITLGSSPQIIASNKLNSSWLFADLILKLLWIELVAI